MSTRAMYTFRDANSEHHVYKHHDGYPTSAAEWIEAALPFAWTLPRFEADEFAAAFVAANKSYWHNEEFKALRALEASPDCEKAKTRLAHVREYAAADSGGGVRLMQSGSVYAVAPSDIEYRYEVTCKAGELHVKAFETDFWDVRSKKSEKRIFQGTLAAFKDAAAELENLGGVGAGRITTKRLPVVASKENAYIYGHATTLVGAKRVAERHITDRVLRVYHSSDPIKLRTGETLSGAWMALTFSTLLEQAKREAAITDLEEPGGVGAQRLGIYWTARSVNKKTGPIPVSTTSAETCPSACPLLGNGCYAKGGNVGILWHALTRHGPNASWQHGASMARSIDWAGLCERVAGLDEGALWRHNQAGDLSHRKQRIAKGKLQALVRANRGKRGFTYTHHVMSAWNRALVRWANATGFTINLSANNLGHADELAETGAGPVVLPINAPKVSVTPAGRTVRMCPATYAEGVTCKRCQWCAMPEREWVVGFPAHGSQKHAAAAIARGIPVSMPVG